MKKKILYGFIVVLIVIQFFGIDKTNPETDTAHDFIVLSNPPEEVATLLESSCYDCHSHATSYPWYSNVAPISWWIKHHIDEGREELNFSTWGSYDKKKKDHKLEEMVEMLEEGEMPLSSYTWTHGEAKLSEADKTLLMDWVEAFRAAAKAPKKKKEVKKLTLNNGMKWEANEETTTSINRMFDIAKEEIEDGRLSHYAAMGERLNLELKTLFKGCTMKGEAHEQLHVFLIPLIEKCESLEFVASEDEAMVLQKDILKDLNNYHNFFE